jgi:hypothetical protein
VLNRTLMLKGLQGLFFWKILPLGEISADVIWRKKYEKRKRKKGKM